MVFHGKSVVCGYLSKPSFQLTAVRLFCLALPGGDFGKHIRANPPKRVSIVQIVLKTGSPGISIAQADKLMQPFGIFGDRQLLSDAPEFLFLFFDEKGKLQIACIFQFIPVPSGPVPRGTVAKSTVSCLCCRKIYFPLFIAKRIIVPGEPILQFRLALFPQIIVSTAHKLFLSRIADASLCNAPRRPFRCFPPPCPPRPGPGQ